MCIRDRVPRNSGHPRDQTAARIVTRPTGHRHDLVENLALVLLAGPRIRLRIPGGDLGTRLHRQPISHAPTASPFRGHSYVRHGERFAGSFRESRRTLDYLGEDTTEEEAAAATVAEYLRLIGALAAAAVAEGTEVSVKLSAVGLSLIGPDGDATYGPDFALREASRIAAAAYGAGARMTLDMEDHTAVDATLDVLFALRRQYPDIGVAIQAMLC